MAEKNTPILSPEYLDFRNEITSRIRSAQYEALKAVNKEMIALYWEIGRRITEQQAALGWGKIRRGEPFAGHTEGVSGYKGVRCFQYVGYGPFLCRIPVE